MININELEHLLAYLKDFINNYFHMEEEQLNLNKIDTLRNNNKNNNLIIDKIESEIKQLKEDIINNRKEFNPSIKSLITMDKIYYYEETKKTCIDKINILKNLINQENMINFDIDEIIYFNFRWHNTYDEKVRSQILKKYDNLKKYIIENCQTLISQNFNTGKFININIEKDFHSDNHGSEFNVYLLNINGKKIVFKPRDSLLDIAIIKLFKTINNTHILSNKLPEFIIINYKNYSFWQYIEPDEITDHNCLSNNIHTKFINFNNKIVKVPIDDLSVISIRDKNLKLLNTICYKIGITDLHEENIIIRNNMFYPIDLENITLGNCTGIYERGKKIGPVLDVPKNIENFIIKFNKNLYFLPIRLVPISTSIFECYINDVISSLENKKIDVYTLEKLFYNFTDKMGYKFFSSEIIDGLQDYFLKCRILKIIPYFYTLYGKIYFKKQ